MIDEVSRMRPHINETGCLNLDRSNGGGTHWVACSKRGHKVIYFDSFGLRPPPEVVQYFKNETVEYNNEKIQKFNETNCGKLCIGFLIKVTKRGKTRQ